MRKKTEEEALRRLLKQYGLDKPTDVFAGQLTQVVVQASRPAVWRETRDRLGRCILAILVGLHMLMIYLLDPGAIGLELAVPAAAFVLGVWGLIALLKGRARTLLTRP